MPKKYDYSSSGDRKVDIFAGEGSPAGVIRKNRMKTLEQADAASDPENVDTMGDAGHNSNGAYDGLDTAHMKKGPYIENSAVRKGTRD